MHTVKLRVNDRIYDKFIWLISKFTKDEVEIIPENADFTTTQKYLLDELNEIRQGTAKFIDLDQAENRLENSIKKYEDSI